MDGDGSAALPKGASVTAVAVAAARAVECTRPDALVCDQYASVLVSAAHAPVDFPAVWPVSGADVPPAQWPLLLGSAYIGLRTRFIDDFVLSSDGPTQVVSLGAGLDARAYRLSWRTGTHLFELDEAGVLEFKSSVLRAAGVVPRCELTSLGTDFSNDWGGVLTSVGFDHAKPTTWIVEGLLPYLSAAAQALSLATLADLSSKGSRCVLERAVPLPHSPELESRLEAFSVTTGLPMSELLARANPPDPAELLQGYGWTAELHSVDQVAAQYGRTLQVPGSPWGEMGESEASQGKAADLAGRGGFVIASCD